MLRAGLAAFLAFCVLAAPVRAADPEPHLDFRTGAGQDAYQWLGEMGFMFERDARDKTKVDLSLSNRGLEMKALSGAQAMVALKKGHLEHYRVVEIEWGVDKFPKGASYANGRRNEAILFYAFFGKETVDSGALIVPDSPYFIALHLCENDVVGQAELGRFYHKGGRFICVAHPKPGEVVKTSFDLKQAFQDLYGFPAPSLYGIAFEFDTTSPRDDGTSSAFVRSINFPKATYIRQD